jgi:hypothetical protein
MTPAIKAMMEKNTKYCVLDVGLSLIGQQTNINTNNAIKIRTTTLKANFASNKVSIVINNVSKKLSYLVPNSTK